MGYFNHHIMNNAIEFDQVSKKFKKGSLLLKEALVEAFKAKKKEQFWALTDITFQLPKGSTLGILGPNGSGKSTMLKLIAEVMYPTTGTVKVNGQIAPLIELGAGFHYELTGRENIYINGTILGLKKKEIDNRIDEIIQFAELRDFIDTPVKHYSSGMFMRLGFAVATHVDPDILLIDEILAVGDQPFQEKCFKKMAAFKEAGVTMVVVSHSVEQLKKYCDTGLVLWHGENKFFGSINEAVERYQQLLQG
jgi:ABC-type polysaccharide/polyol phosphate transport system ATPase subunit